VYLKIKTMEYVGVHKKEKLVGIIDLDEVEISFLDRMFEQGYEFRKISKKLLAGHGKFLTFV